MGAPREGLPTEGISLAECTWCETHVAMDKMKCGGTHGIINMTFLSSHVENLCAVDSSPCSLPTHHLYELNPLYLT